MPLTADGTIMVDGVLASCYASSDHDLAHLVMLPMTWFPDILERIFSTEEGWQVYLKVFQGHRWMDCAYIQTSTRSFFLNRSNILNQYTLTYTY